MVSLFRIDTVQHALDGGRWCQGHGIIEQRVAFADFADRQAVSVQRRDGIQPPLNPRSLRWSFITASREAFCTMPRE